MSRTTNFIVCLMIVFFAMNTYAQQTSIFSDKNSVFAKHHVGFALYDLQKDTMLLTYQESQNFVAASNTKLFTFYASLKALGDSIPSFMYEVRNDSLIVWGTGDPSFLNPVFSSKKSYHFLMGHQGKVFFSPANFSGTFYGKGWSWDDYNDDYMAEISPFPIYGNLAQFAFKTPNKLSVMPSFFADKTSLIEGGEKFEIIRQLEQNLFGIPKSPIPPARFSQWIPFKTSPILTAKLLSDTLHREVQLLDAPLSTKAKKFYATSGDSLYKQMLFQSDNFVAEQLMLMLANDSLGVLNVSKGIEQAQKAYLTDLPDTPRWVDGSGLSRYNLATPRTLISVLKKLYQLVPEERLFKLLPAAGQSGTIKKLVPATNHPYIFAKSGSMGGIYNLSGYLITRSGKRLAFSFMNNNVSEPLSSIRKAIAAFLINVSHEY
ncbi:MAG: D-alanyl-D-alanine carboxypeptidase/D-alanyl-D-alanine-endopeptidase [Spirosomataceae bacterium]